MHKRRNTGEDKKGFVQISGSKICFFATIYQLKPVIKNTLTAGLSFPATADHQNIFNSRIEKIDTTNRCMDIYLRYEIRGCDKIEPVQ